MDRLGETMAKWHRWVLCVRHGVYGDLFARVALLTQRCAGLDTRTGRQMRARWSFQRATSSALRRAVGVNKCLTLQWLRTYLDHRRHKHRVVFSVSRYCRPTKWPMVARAGLLFFADNCRCCGLSSTVFASTHAGKCRAMVVFLANGKNN